MGSGDYVIIYGKRFFSISTFPPLDLSLSFNQVYGGVHRSLLNRWSDRTV